MKLGDIVWFLLFVVVIGFIISPWTRSMYESAVAAQPYLVGYAKFFILAPMGELLANRIATKQWKMTVGILPKAILWGFYGMLITLTFQLFALGAQAVMKNEFLPGGDNAILFAVFASVMMNLFFAPFMMGLHKTTDTWVDLRVTTKNKVRFQDAVDAVDWRGFVNFTVLKVIPRFWIPAHTVSFLLPPNLRVAMAAVLSVAFGVIVAYTKMRKPAN